MTQKIYSRHPITFPLMDALLKAGNSGIIADYTLAKKLGCSASGLSMNLNKLCKMGLVICTDPDCSKNQRVSIPQNIKHHYDWLVVFYKTEKDVPRRYRKYIDEHRGRLAAEEELVSKSSQSLSDKVREAEANLSSLLADALAENDKLKHQVKELTEIIKKAKAIIATSMDLFEGI